MMPILLDTKMKVKQNIPYIILTVIVMAIYANTLGHGFVWDDRIFVSHRSGVYKEFDLAAIFFTLSANGLEYLPVRDVSYALDFALWGSNPAGFHFSNILLYLLNVMVIYALTLRLGEQCQRSFNHETSAGSRTTAFLTAALFAVHPLHGEAVNFITARNALLCGLFFFLTCHTYLHYLSTSAGKRRGWYLAAFIFFALALFSKATAIILPLILVICTYAFRRPKQLSGWLPLLPFAVLSVGGFFLFKHVATLNRIIASQDEAETTAAIMAKFAMALQIPFFYLYKMLIPVNYSVDYDMKQFGSTLTDPLVAGSLLLLIGLATAVRLLKRQRSFLAFCAVWYLLSLLPVLHLFPTNPVVADRYAFLPSYPVFFLLSAGYVTLTRRFPRGQLLCAAIVLSALALAAGLHNRIWKSDRSLWEYTAKTSPHSAVAHVNLARILFIEENEYAAGLQAAKKAQQLYPRDTNYDVFQGVLHLRGNDPQSAIIDFNRALERSDGHVETLVNLATAYQLLGDRTKAIYYLQRAVNSPEPYAPGDLRETASDMLRALTEGEPGVDNSL